MKLSGRIRERTAESEGERAGIPPRRKEISPRRAVFDCKEMIKNIIKRIAGADYPQCDHRETADLLSAASGITSLVPDSPWRIRRVARGTISSRGTRCPSTSHCR